MTINKIILLSKKAWVLAKRFWWAIVLLVLVLCAGLISIAMRNGALFKRAMDLFDAKRDQHDQEMETLSHIHNTEVVEKNLRLEGHLKEKENLKNLKRFVMKTEMLLWEATMHLTIQHLIKV